jgi:hypothetical protein
MAEGRFEGLDEIYARNFVAHGASADYTLEQDSDGARIGIEGMTFFRFSSGRIVEGPGHLGSSPTAAASSEVRAPPWAMVRPDYVTSVTAGGRGRGRI